MSGAPTEAEIQSQWKAAIDIIETVRIGAETLIVGPTLKIDALLQQLEGDYLPSELSAFASSIRGGFSDMVSPAMAQSIITPVLFEYARILKESAAGGQGSNYSNASELFRALYEWFHANSLTVKSRAITYAAASAAGSNVGNAVISRLTVDENNYKLEACTVEKKQFRCRSDQTSGTDKWAEVFEVGGSAASFDNMLRYTYGSGSSARTTITARHAGTGSGGSLLTNASFSDYTSTATPKFTGWTESSGGSQVSQDTTNYYRTHPGASVNASLKLTAGASTILLKQPITSMRVRRLDPNVPYFLRIMVNKTIGSAVGGNLVVRLGSQSVTTAISALGANWVEVLIPIGQNNWFRRFNKDALTVEIEWNTQTSGYLLLDDMLFAPYDLIDGTYWILRHTNTTPVASMVDDLYTVTDSGGAPANAKIQWWLWVSGYGYLPSSATPTLTDPT
jgi:hypothetical protein